MLQHNNLWYYHSAMMATRRSNHSTVPRRQWQGMVEPARAAVRRLGALAGLAQAHVLGDKDVLAHPRPRLVAAHLRAQPVAGGDAEAVSSTLSSAVKEATIHQKHPALWRACRVGDRRAVPIDEHFNLWSHWPYSDIIGTIVPDAFVGPRPNWSLPKSQHCLARLRLTGGSVSITVPPPGASTSVQMKTSVEW